MSDTFEPHDETGRPITELSRLSESPARTFNQRVRNSIGRRVFAAQTVDFSVVALFSTLFDYLDAVLQTVLGRGGERRS